MLRCNATRLRCISQGVHVCVFMCKSVHVCSVEHSQLGIHTICYSESYSLLYSDSAFRIYRKRSLCSGESKNKSVPLIPVIYLRVLPRFTYSFFFYCCCFDCLIKTEDIN